MAKMDIPPGWVHQAYRYEVDRHVRYPTIASHEGASRFAWNWGLALVESQLQARNVYRVLAIRSGASMAEAEKWAKDMVPVAWSRQALRRIWNEEKELICARSEEERAVAAENVAARQVFETLALRQGATRTEARNFANKTVPRTGWWAENSKETYSCAFEALERAFANYFDSVAGSRRGARVGRPRYKSRRGRQSESFADSLGNGCLDRARGRQQSPDRADQGRSHVGQHRRHHRRCRHVPGYLVGAPWCCNKEGIPQLGVGREKIMRGQGLWRRPSRPRPPTSAYLQTTVRTRTPLRLPARHSSVPGLPEGSGHQVAGASVEARRSLLKDRLALRGPRRCLGVPRPCSGCGASAGAATGISLLLHSTGSKRESMSPAR